MEKVVTNMLTELKKQNLFARAVQHRQLTAFTHYIYRVTQHFHLQQTSSCQDFFVKCLHKYLLKTNAANIVNFLHCHSEAYVSKAELQSAVSNQTEWQTHTEALNNINSLCGRGNNLVHVINTCVCCVSINVLWCECWNIRKGKWKWQQSFYAGLR